MKITISTPFDSANFGAFLQAYCLKTYLQEHGHDVYHLKTRSQDYVEELYYHKKPVGRKEKLFKSIYEKQKQFGEEKYQIFKEEQKCFNVINDTKGTDIVILGSDEIWNVNHTAFQNAVFWGDNLIPTISYAPSIGSAKLEDFEAFPDQIEQINSLKSYLVRDTNTAKMVKKYTGIEPMLVCDPTILLPVNSYGDNLQDNFVSNNRCLLVYAYRLDKKNINAIKKYARSKGLKTVSCCFFHEWCDYQCKCGPLEFSSLIKQCEEVITTTFHGSIFSMLNHANFICFPKSVKSNQLLETFGLQDRIIEKDQVSQQRISQIMQREIDYGEVEQKIKKWRNNSDELLSTALVNAVESHNVFQGKVCFSGLCTGCMACANVCPQKAITLTVDKLGRMMPQVDKKLCVGCMVCKKKCPQNNTPTLYEPKVCYAAQRADIKKRDGSTSGGVATLLSEEFALCGGAVCGALVSDGIVKHKVVNRVDELKYFKNSKYVQSDISSCYIEVQEKLKEGKKVLFIGTPCQVAAMRTRFERFKEFYCVDIVCHGVSPMTYLQAHLDNISGGVHVYSGLRFREGQAKYILSAYEDEKRIYSCDRDHDSYYYSFRYGISNRENCFNCKYAKPERTGDITLGDFWRLNKESLKNKYDGNISLIFENTEKGHELLNTIKTQMVYEERPIEEAVLGNSQLYSPAYRHKRRMRFLKGYLNNGKFDEAINYAKIDKEMKNNNRKAKIYSMVRPLINAVRKGK